MTNCVKKWLTLFLSAIYDLFTNNFNLFIIKERVGKTMNAKNFFVCEKLNLLLNKNIAANHFIFIKD